ncbi:hypothetical protein AGMMS49957_16890 [Synergistales bacterium]|nr:hypothetical protein AGMMS49957_16890 [Synergistales bacterium]
MHIHATSNNNAEDTSGARYRRSAQVTQIDQILTKLRKTAIDIVLGQIVYRNFMTMETME